MRLAAALFLAIFLLHAPAYAVIVYPNPPWTVEMQKNAEGGDPINQMWLGLAYKTGWGIKQDLAEGLKWLRRSADHGYVPANVEIAEMYAPGLGWGVTGDYAEAEKRLRGAADQGNTDAMVDIGWMYANGKGVKQDKKEAEKWFRTAAEQGDAAAKQTLAYNYATGRGVPKDEAEGMKWWFKAAEQGGVQAFLNIGQAYEHGWGVKQDKVEAYFWISLWDKEMIQGGGSPTELEKGLTSEQIAAVKQRVREWKPSNNEAAYGFGNDAYNRWNFKEALEILQPLADQGDVRAQHIIGGVYYEGDNINGIHFQQGVKQDYAEAMKWFRKAAEHGYWKSQLSIARMYLNGIGVKQDDAEAYFWLSLSAKGKIFSLDDEYYTKHLTSEQKAAVDKRVADWLKDHPAPAAVAPPCCKP